MTKLATLIAATTAYPAPEDREELLALIDLLRPNIEQLAAHLVALPQDSVVPAVREVHAAWSAPGSPFAVELPIGRDCYLEAQTSLASAVARHPDADAARQDLVARALSNHWDQPAPPAPRPGRR